MATQGSYINIISRNLFFGYFVTIFEKTDFNKNTVRHALEPILNEQKPVTEMKSWGYRPKSVLGSSSEVEMKKFPLVTAGIIFNNYTRSRFVSEQV